MEINSSNPVGDGVQGPGLAQKISEVKREKDETPDQQSTRAEESPDYRISLSDTSKKAVSDLASTQATGQVDEKSDLSEDEAARMARQTAEKLAQTNTGISSQAIQKAVDLFT